MNNNRHPESSASITLGDVYFAIFRHKWKIVLLSAVGVVAAAVFYLLHPPLYQSEAELLIRYITDRAPVSAPEENLKMTAPNGQGSGAIYSEVNILESFDLVQQVAATIGPEKILAKAGGGKDLIKAAAVVRNGLIVTVAQNSSVINIVFQHPDATIVQPVLNEIIIEYLNKHTEIHQALGTEDDFLAEETTQLRSQIAQTERELMSAKTNVGIISLDDAKKTVAEQISKIQGQILDVEVEVATHQGGVVRTDFLSTATKPGTNAATAQIPSGQVDQYNKLCRRLDVLQRKNSEFLGQGYTEESVLVKDVGDQIVKAKQQKNEMEGKYRVGEPRRRHLRPGRADWRFG